MSTAHAIKLHSAAFSKKRAGIFAGMIILQDILYGAMDIVSKYAYRTMPVSSFLFLRYALAAILMLLLWGNVILRELRRTPMKHYVVPASAMALAFIFSNLALKYTAASNMSFLRSLSVIMVPVLLVLFRRGKYTRHDVFLQAGVLAGLYLLCAKGGAGGFGIGEVFALTAAALVAAALVFGQSALGSIHPCTLSFAQTILSLLVTGVMTLVSGTADSFAAAADPVTAASLFFGAAGCTVGGYMLQNTALTRIPASAAGMLQSLYPVCTAVFSYFFLRERLSAAGILGAAIILTCVFAENMMRARTDAHAVS